MIDPESGGWFTVFSKFVRKENDTLEFYISILQFGFPGPVKYWKKPWKKLDALGHPDVFLNGRSEPNHLITESRKI